MQAKPTVRADFTFPRMVLTKEPENRFWQGSREDSSLRPAGRNVKWRSPSGRQLGNSSKSYSYGSAVPLPGADSALKFPQLVLTQHQGVFTQKSVQKHPQQLQSQQLQLNWWTANKMSASATRWSITSSYKKERLADHGAMETQHSGVRKIMSSKLTWAR